MVRGVLSFPPDFDVADFIVAWGSEAPQLASRFLTNGISIYIAVELVCP